MAAITSAVLAGAALASTTASYFEQKKAGRKAARKQEEANDVSTASAQVENARNRRKAIAQARIAQAQNQASAGSSVQTSSAVSGVNSSLASQLGSNIGAQNQRIGSQMQIQGLNQQAANAIRTGQERSGLLNLASQGFGFGAQMTAGMGGAGERNMQGQSSALNNNSAFVARS